MATKEKAATAAKKTTTTAVVAWDEKLAAKAKAAQRVASTIGGGSGNFLSFKGGKLSFKEARMPDDQMECIVLAAVTENNWFAEKFNPKVPQSPKCYAFGSPDGDDENMGPHEAVKKAGNSQSETGRCADCPHNEWGSAETGRGKACKNQVRLALIPASVLQEDDPEAAIKKAEIAYAKLPVTSGKNWSGYVNQLGDKHFLQFVTRLSLVDDGDDYFHTEFEAVDEIKGKVIGALVDRSDREEKAIGFAYPEFEEQAKPQGRAAGARKPVPAKKSATPARKPSKY